ncbi:ABC transporter permease [Phreatobacter sp. AB_2022a]|uniref:ABC transporter permease n=1 Tax=Phreatobacter sp. AB_2022a TaxID=3003134 RepID=UPI0022876E65|nr:ABC transporter permease [Phreatobacter sp. AB_2022a]MCZ0737704.1 ABC transporter permease [Phreatobacter sp. AB_2022a]
MTDLGLSRPAGARGGLCPRLLTLAGGPAIALRLAAVAALCVALALATPNFLTETNILNVLRQAALLFLVGSGLTLVLIGGGIDLSVGANLGLSACLAALTLKATDSLVLTLLVGLATGTVIGLANGLAVAVMRIPPFIATYGMLWVLLGITYRVMAGESVHGFPPRFRFLGSGHFLGIPVPAYLMFVFLAVGGLFLARTRWGQEVYAMGANPEAARLSGIPVRSRQILTYTLSGAMAGLAALVFLARVNSAEGDIGEAMTLPAITAVLIGGTSLFGGVGTVTGTFIGALILTLVINGMNLLSVHSNWQPLVAGVIVILAVLVDSLTNRRRT